MNFASWKLLNTRSSCNVKESFLLNLMRKDGLLLNLACDRFGCSRSCINRRNSSSRVSCWSDGCWRWVAQHCSHQRKAKQELITTMPHQGKKEKKKSCSLFSITILYTAPKVQLFKNSLPTTWKNSNSPVPLRLFINTPRSVSLKSLHFLACESRLCLLPLHQFQA